MDDRTRDGEGRSGATERGAGRGGDQAPSRFTSTEITILGLLAALWTVLEVSIGGVIRGWHLPLSGAFLATIGVVVLLTARAAVPRRWSSLVLGLVVAGIRGASGLGGAVFAAIGIAAEAAVVEVVLSGSALPTQRRRMLAGASAVLWTMAHPFVVQGYVAGLGPQRVYNFSIGLFAGGGGQGVATMFLAILFLAIVHIALGVSAALFVDRVLAPAIARARDGGPGASGRGLVLLWPALLAAGMVAAAPVSSQAQASGTAVYSLPELTVYGTRLFGPYVVENIDADEIRESGADDLSDVLGSVPGLNVRVSSKGEVRLSSRGFTQREIVVTVDGVPISDPYTGSVNTNALLAGGIDGVRVTRGGAASIYGANAMGGLVEVSTAGRRDGLSYSVSAGSDERYSGHFAAGGAVGAARVGGGVSLNGVSDFSLPSSYEEELNEDGGRRDHSSRDDVFAWGSAGWSLSETAEASVTLHLSEGSWDAPAETTDDRPRYYGFPRWREVRAIGSAAWRPSEDALVEGRVFYSTNDNVLVSYSDPERTDVDWMSTVANHAYGGYLYGEFRGVANQTISAGLNVRSDFASNQGDVGEDWDEYDATTVSFFAQDLIPVGGSDGLSVAANVDLLSGDSGTLTSVSPQVGWTHGFPGGFSVRALGGMKTRFPTLKELYSPSIGNEDLDPERAVSAELEIARMLPGGTGVSVVAFTQRIEDMIVSSGKGDPAENVGEVDVAGVEVGATWAASRHLKAECWATFTQTEGDDEEGDVAFMPETTGSLRLRYYPGQFGLNAVVDYVGERYGSDGGTLDAYALLCVRASYDTPVGTVFAGVDNVLDALYEDDEGYPQQGRSLEVGISRDLSR